MGSNKNKNSGQSGASGNDPRGRLQNQSEYQQQRYEGQQGPLANAMAQNYGYGSEANIGDYTDIMNQYRSIASGGGSDDSGGGGGGGGFDASGMYTPFTVDYSDPFNSYGGFQDFSATGGYSSGDMANLRARGVSPIRAAYANAERELQKGRALQGGYSPNMAAAQVKMAREQGQSAADAVQNVEAGIVDKRNQGKLAGLTGMSGIEGQRLNAQIDVGKFNADAQARAQAQNIGAAASAASGRAAASSENQANRLRALAGMTSLYGTTPGMAATFGNQAINIVGQGGQFGNQLYGNDINAQKAPGQYEQDMGRFKDIYNTGATVAAPIIDYFSNRKKQQQPYGNNSNGGYGNNSGYYSSGQSDTGNEGDY